MLVLFSEVLMVGIYYYTLLKFVKKIWQRRVESTAQELIATSLLTHASRSNSSIEIAGPSSPPLAPPHESLHIEMQPVQSTNLAQV